MRPRLNSIHPRRIPIPPPLLPPLQLLHPKHRRRHLIHQHDIRTQPRRLIEIHNGAGLRHALCGPHVDVAELVFRQELVVLAVLGWEARGEGHEVDSEGVEVVEGEEMGAEGEEAGEETVEVFEVVGGVVVGHFADGGRGIHDVTAGSEVEHSGDDVCCHAKVCE